MKRSSLSGVLLAGIMLLAAAALPVQAEIYTYQDGQGMFIYADDLGKIPVKYRSRATLIDDSTAVSVIDADTPPGGNAKAGAKPARKQAKVKERFSGTIEMYVTEWCPVCKDAEKYLKQMNYPYNKYDVEKDKSAKERAAEYPGRGVPLIIVGKRNFRGFSPEALEQYMRD